jgi:hypothetical protein
LLSQLLHHLLSTVQRLQPLLLRHHLLHRVLPVAELLSRPGTRSGLLGPELWSRLLPGRLVWRSGL